MRIVLVKTVKYQREHIIGRIVVIEGVHYFLDPKLYYPLIFLLM
jgi:hypothetical protein